MRIQTDTRILSASVFLTLLVVLLDRAGVFTTWSEQLLDYVQRIAPRDTAPMDDRIVMVDIDDRALERLGRWPWPRTDLAHAIAELQHAGARTIAVDLDLADPQQPSVSPTPPHTEIDRDRQLSDAIGDSVVLGVLLMPDELRTRWFEAGGSPKGLVRVIMALKKDLSWDPSTHPMALSTDDQAAARSVMHLLRRRAIHHRINDGQTADDVRTLAGEHGGALQPTIDAAVRQAQGRQAIRGDLAHQSFRSPTTADRFPLPSFAEGTSGVGYVNIVQRDQDGGVRRIHASQPIGHQEAILPLGLAAAARFLGIAPDDIELSEESLQLGDIRLPVLNEAITVSWPRSTHGMYWPDLHRDMDAERFAGHLSIGEIVMLGRSRTLYEHQRDLQREASSDLLPALSIAVDPAQDIMSAEIQSLLEEEVEFALGDVNSRASLEQALDGYDASTQSMMHRMLDWRFARQAAQTTANQIATVEASLRNHVSDRLVFIGWTGTGTTADFVPTAAGARTPGVMVHAAMADMVLQQRTLQELPDWWSSVMAAAIGLIIALITATLTAWPATISTVLIAGGWIGAAGLLVAQSAIVLPLAAPLVCIVMSWAGGTAARAVVVQREKRRISRQFRARVPVALVDELARDPNALSMRGVRREVCVMFGDLAGFTTISEQLDSEDTVALLNQAMSGLTQRVTIHGAYLNKFLGDGFLAFWSAFGPQEDQATLAADAALACQQFMDDLNQSMPEAHTRLGLRIGIAIGEATVGDCGAPPELNDYTVIGDVANLAARLESANKQFGTQIMIDGATKAQLSEDHPLLEIGPVRVVGRDAVVDVWTLTTEPPSEAMSQASADFAAAVRAGNRNAALEALSVLETLDTDQMRLDRYRQVVEVTPEMPRAINLTDK